MIEIKGNNGEPIVSVSPDLFPLSMAIESPTGVRNYKIHLNYVRDREGNKTDRTKNINVTIDRD